MTYLFWHRSGDARIASPRLVLRATEVPVLQDALAVRDAWLAWSQDERARAAAAAERTRADAQAAFAEARLQGLDEGREAGRREAREALADTVTTLAREAAVERERLQGAVAALALQVARKLLGRLADDERLAALADTAAAEALTGEPLAVLVHPAQADGVRARLSAAATTRADALRCEVRADPALALDACIVETEHGRIDAALDAQLARLGAAWGIEAPAHASDEERT